MTVHISTKILGSVAAVIIAYWGYTELVANPREQIRRTVTDTDINRFQEWAYVAKDKEIKPGERLKLVIVPSPWGEYFDTKCLIYTNNELKQSSMICPDANKDFIKESEQ
jgi:hypothetical protein